MYCRNIKREQGLKGSDPGFNPCSNHHLDLLSLQSLFEINQSIIYRLIPNFRVSSQRCLSRSLRCLVTSVALLSPNYLFIVKSPRWINRQNQTRHDANEHSIESCANGHTTQRQPDFCESLGRIPPVSNTQHVWHGFKQSPAVLFGGRFVLKK